MKRRLNLFSQRSATKKVVSYYVLARKVALIVFIGLIIIMIFLGGTFFYFNIELTKLESSQQKYERYIAGNKVFSQEIQQFVYKYKKLTSYMDSDAKSYAFYVRLAELLSQTKSNEVLNSFSIDNTRETTFELSFASYEDAMTFVEELETPLILDVFEKITLSGLDVVKTSDASYELSLSGTFKPLTPNGSL
ncbi:hypothetical protein KBD81_05000 [Candidatus Woesebacteria bacterium]|nr:hypothetical protein [Candidatus Woesebacteria bacterium]